MKMLTPNFTYNEQDSLRVGGGGGFGDTFRNGIFLHR